MAAENDPTGWLPDPPPPRPARRDAAIDTAMRRFDGVGEPAAAPERRGWSWPRMQRPQMAAVVSSLLLLAIGVPLAVTGLRDLPAPSEPAPAADAPRVNDAAVPPRGPAPMPAAPNAPAALPQPGASPDKPEPAPAGQTATALNKTDAPAAPSAAAPPVPVIADAGPARAPAAAPPPPQAPPPPAEVAGGDEASSQEIVLTGTRIPRPNLTAPQALEVKERGAAPASRTVAAANAHYAAFLSRLQTAIRADNRGAVVALVGFPLRVSGAGGSRLYPDAGSVERDYERIFTPRVRSAILRQRSDRLLVRDNGATIAQGAVRLSRSRADAPIRITAVSP